MANNSQIQLTGLIPASSANYVSNYQINDNTIGKYISLNGAKKFYNPGIDLTLSSPTTASTQSSITAVKNFIPSNVSLLLNNTSGGNCGYFLILDTTNPTGDSIPGFVSNSLAINNATAPGLTNINSIVSQGNIRVLNVLTSGSYTFSFNINLTVNESSSHSFSFDFGFYLNINGVEISIPPLFVVSTYTTNVGGQAGNLGVLDYVIPTYTHTVNLNTGDYVQLYAKCISYYKGLTATAYVNSGFFTISLNTTTTPTQTTFGNPLHLTDFNTSGINFYGANRDTLLLQGTLLTNI